MTSNELDAIAGAVLLIGGIFVVGLLVAAAMGLSVLARVWRAITKPSASDGADLRTRLCRYYQRGEVHNVEYMLQQLPNWPVTSELMGVSKAHCAYHAALLQTQQLRSSNGFDLGVRITESEVLFNVWADAAGTIWSLGRQVNGRQRELPDKCLKDMAAAAAFFAERTVRFKQMKESVLELMTHSSPSSYALVSELLGRSHAELRGWTGALTVEGRLVHDER